MNTETSIPAESMTIEHNEPNSVGSGLITIKPKITVSGTTFTIRLEVDIPTAGGTNTFVLSHANNWTDKKTYFAWPQKTDIGISIDRTHKRIHVRVAPPVVDPIDKYISYSALELPGHFDLWRPHTGPEFDELTKLIGTAKPVGKSPGIHVSVDSAGVQERCEFLGHPDFTKNATSALQAGNPARLDSTDGSSVLFAVGLLGDASAYVGASLGGGFWWTDDAECGLYGGVGAQMGGIVGANLQLTYTVVIAAGGKSAIENFEQFHIARGVVGEGPTGSIALLGDVTSLEIYGFMFGGGIGGGTPAGGYVGASRQALLNF